MMGLKDKQPLFHVEGFEFESLEGPSRAKNEHDGFSQSSWEQVEIEEKDKDLDEIKRERISGERSLFKMMPEVFEGRGLSEQKAKEQREEVEAIVQKEIERVKQQAYEEGVEKGRQEGRDQSLQEAKAELEGNLQRVKKAIENLQESQKDLLHKNQSQMLDVVKAISKWVLLKEYDGKPYLFLLLKKLINEIGEKEHLVLKVHPKITQDIKTILPEVQDVFGELKNFRLEENAQLEVPGMILESKNLILNADLKSQFQSIDRLFDDISQTASVEE